MSQILNDTVGSGKWYELQSDISTRYYRNLVKVDLYYGTYIESLLQHKEALKSKLRDEYETAATFIQGKINSRNLSNGSNNNNNIDKLIHHMIMPKNEKANSVISSNGRIIQEENPLCVIEQSPGLTDGSTSVTVAVVTDAPNGNKNKNKNKNKNTSNGKSKNNTRDRVTLECIVKQEKHEKNEKDLKEKKQSINRKNNSNSNGNETKNGESIINKKEKRHESTICKDNKKMDKVNCKFKIKKTPLPGRGIRSNRFAALIKASKSSPLSKSSNTASSTVLSKSKSASSSIANINTTQFNGNTTMRIKNTIAIMNGNNNRNNYNNYNKYNNNNNINNGNEDGVTFDVVQSQADGSVFYKCRICDNVCSTAVGAKYHYNAEHSTKYQCSYCGRCCANKFNLTSHVRGHTGEKPFQCNVCKKYFSTKGNLRVHSRIHTNEKPYQCRFCTKCFAQKSSQISHEKRCQG